MLVRSQWLWCVKYRTAYCCDLTHLGVQLYGLKVFIACLKLVSYVELEDDERSFPAIEWALHAARPICIAVWDELKFTSPCHDFQLLYLAHQLIHCLILLGISDEYQDLFR